MAAAKNVLFFKIYAEAVFGSYYDSRMRTSERHELDYAVETFDELEVWNILMLHYMKNPLEI